MDLESASRCLSKKLIVFSSKAREHEECYKLLRAVVSKNGCMRCAGRVNSNEVSELTSPNLLVGGDRITVGLVLKRRTFLRRSP